jgi:hypothetical protein
MRVPTLAFTDRYLFTGCACSIGEGAKARILGYRQLVTIGQANVGAGESPTPRFVEQEVTSPFWRFSDGNVWMGLRQAGGPNWQGAATATPVPGTPPRGTSFQDSMAPSLLYEEITLPVGNTIYPDLTAYVPPNHGRPWGRPIQSGNDWLSLQTQWRTHGAWHSMDLEVEGPDTIAIFISVLQSNPSTRRPLGSSDVFRRLWGGTVPLNIERYLPAVGCSLMWSRYEHHHAGGNPRRPRFDDLRAGCTDGFDQHVADFQDALGANAGQPPVLETERPAVLLWQHNGPFSHARFRERPAGPDRMRMQPRASFTRTASRSARSFAGSRSVSYSRSGSDSKLHNDDHTVRQQCGAVGGGRGVGGGARGHVLRSPEAEGTTTMNTVPVGPLLKSIAPPQGGVWMHARSVPANLWAAPWQNGHADSGSHGVNFSFRKADAGGQTYMQLYANDVYHNFVAGKFTATSLAGVPTGMGALTDDDVQSAAGMLLAELQSAGCTPGFSDAVQSFQQAYITAGGNLPNDSDGSSGVDGLYGANTQAALQSVLDAGTLQPPQKAPAGCVGAGGGGGSVVTPTVVVPGTVPSSSSGMSHNAKMALIAAGLLGVGIVGYALYRKNKRVRVVHLRKV